MSYSSRLCLTYHYSNIIKSSTSSGCLQAGRLFMCRKSLKVARKRAVCFPVVINHLWILAFLTKIKFDLLRLRANSNLSYYRLAYIVQPPAQFIWCNNQVLYASLYPWNCYSALKTTPTNKSIFSDPDLYTLSGLRGVKKRQQPRFCVPLNRYSRPPLRG